MSRTPKEPTTQLSIRITEDVKRQLEHEAEKASNTLNGIINLAIREYLEHRKGT